MAEPNYLRIAWMVRLEVSAYDTSMGDQGCASTLENKKYQDSRTFLWSCKSVVVSSNWVL